MPSADITWIQRWRVRAALAVGSAACFVLLGTVVPPFVMLQIPASIVGTECAQWLLFAGVIAVTLAAPPAADRRRTRRTALVLGGCAILLAGRTLVQIPAAVRNAEAEMRRAFGERYAGITTAPHPDTPCSLAILVAGLPNPEVEATEADYAAPSGAPLRCDLFRPAGGTALPIVLAVHGGAWSGGSRSEASSINRALAGCGFLVASIDYRLAPEHRFPAQVEDVHAAISWLRAHAAEHGGDPRRIALIGRSAGAQLAFLAAADEGTGIAAVAGLYSPVDFTVGYREPGFPDPIGTRPVFEEYLGGTPDDMPQRYRDASPIEQAARVRAPVLLITGERDHLVSISYTRQLADRLRQGGTPVAVLGIPWSEHAFDAIANGPGSQLALHHLIRFLRLELAAGG